MRNIEFRGWDKELKKWHYGNYYFYTDTIYCMASDKDNEENKHHCILFDGFCDWNMPRPHYKAFVDKNTIGQFTGLYDKNGVKIFEGDIVKADWGYQGVVDFEDFIYAKLENTISENIEVVGNIHENKEKERE